MIRHLTITIPLILVGLLVFLPLANMAYSQLSDVQVLEKYKGANENETLQNIQAAVNNKSLACSDVPSGIIAFNCPDTQQKLADLKTHSPPDHSTNLSHTSIDSNSNNMSSEIVTVIAVILSGLMVLKLWMRGHRYTKYGALLVLAAMIGMLAIWNTGMDDNGRVGASVIDCGVFLGIAIAFFVRGSQESRFASVRENTQFRNVGIRDSDNDDDLSTVEDAVITYDRKPSDVYYPLYDEEHEATLKSDGTPLYNKSKDQNSKIRTNPKQGSLKSHRKLLYSLGILKEKKK